MIAIYRNFIRRPSWALVALFFGGIGIAYYGSICVSRLADEKHVGVPQFIVYWLVMAALVAAVAAGAILAILAGVAFVRRPASALRSELVRRRREVLDARRRKAVGRR